ncbi:MAG: imidazole glycerol phosphate synthase subunit HisH [Duodenibacillus sp.]|nr:imidazole glycerol phosphate synthase subunit HisH [Duodenibacillus sp.]
MSRIAIVDYGTGNLRSVSQAVRAAAPDCEVLVTGCAQDIARADRVIFPGQGAMGDCMRNLEASGLKDTVLQALAQKPVLAICIGLQMLFEKSDENDCAGLGLYKGKVIRFPQAALMTASGVRLKVPQMGWNTVQQRQHHPVWDGIADGSWFYFVHSYFVAPEDDTLTAATTSYGLPFVCAVARDNVFATQFHPEKSADAGLRLFANFVHWNP